METLGQNFDLHKGIQEVLERLDINFPFSVIDENDCITQQAIQHLGNFAGTIFKLGERIAQGFNPQKEIGKLAKRLGSIFPDGFPSDSSPPNEDNLLSESSGITQNHPWSQRNALAESRLPESGCIYSRAVQRRNTTKEGIMIHRGPERYSK